MENCYVCDAETNGVISVCGWDHRPLCKKCYDKLNNGSDVSGMTGLEKCPFCGYDEAPTCPDCQYHEPINC